MRILFCNYEYPPLGGGGGVINALLAEELARKHDVTVVSSLGPGLQPTSIVNGVRVVRVPVYFRKELAAANFPSMFAYMINGVRAGRKLLREERFDVINTHFALPSGPVGARLAKEAGIPNVLSVHGGDLYDPSKFSSPHRHWLLRRWVRSLLHAADAVVGNSENTNFNVRRYYTEEVAPALIPLGIRRPQVVPANRSDYGFSSSDVLWVTVGRLVGRKAIDRLIQLLAREVAAKRAAGTTSPVKLLVVGSGPLEDSLRQLTQQLGVADRVYFSGFVSEQEKYKLLSIADIFVSVSQHEGFGLVFLEAMAAGLPVICYDFGGQADFLASEQTGYLVPLNDEQSMLRRCQALSEDVSQRRTMARHNREVVEAFFIENCARRYEDLFRALTDKPSQRDDPEYRAGVLGNKKD